MEFIAVVSYLIVALFSCIALIFGYLAVKQIKADNSCDEESYKKFKKYLKLMMATFGMMIIGVVLLAVYVLIIR